MVINEMPANDRRVIDFLTNIVDESDMGSKKVQYDM